MTDRDDLGGWANVLPLEVLEDVPPETRIPFQKANAVASKSVDWIWRGYLPRGKIIDVYGDGDVGKTMVLLDIAARVSTGRAMPDGTPGIEASNVLYFSAEDDLADTLRPRLEAAGADLDRIHVSCGDSADERGEYSWLSLKRDLDSIRDAFCVYGPAICAFDPILAFMGQTKTGIDADVRGVLGPLRVLAEEHGCSIINLRHINKASGASANMRGGSSVAFRNVARAGLVFGQHPDDEDLRVLAPNKNNLSKRHPALAYRIVGDGSAYGVPRVDWQGPVDFSPDEILEPPRSIRGSERRASEKEKCAERIRAFLEAEGGSMRSDAAGTQLREEGFSKYAIEGGRKLVGVRAIRSRTDDEDCWRWVLPDQAEEIPPQPPDSVEGPEGLEEPEDPGLVVATKLPPAVEDPELSTA